MSVQNQNLGQTPSHQFYPHYYQCTSPEFSYIFKVKDSSSLTLKVYNTSQKCIVKQTVSSEKLGQEYMNRISDGKDYSILLERLVTIGALPREYFAISTKIDQVQQLIQIKEWTNGEKIALEGLKEENESEKMKYFELLEEIYTQSAPEKLEQLWISQGAAYMRTSRFSEAEKIFEKTFKRFKSYHAAYHLAQAFSAQKKVNQSVQTYYEALTIAFFNEEYEKTSLCIKEIRKVDSQMQQLDNNQRIFLLTQSQLLNLSEKFQLQQRDFLKFLALTPAQHYERQLDCILERAIAQEEVDIVKMIISNYDLIPINQGPHNQELFIVIAVRKGNEEIIKILLTHPDINIDCKSKHGNPRLASLSIAETAGFKNIVTILYNHSQSLEQDFNAFKCKSLGRVQRLHVYVNNNCRIISGITAEGDRKLLDISCPKQALQPLEKTLAELVDRGLNCPEDEKTRVKQRNNLSQDDEKVSNEIGELIKGTIVDPLSEAVVYRAIKLRGKGFFTE